MNIDSPSSDECCWGAKRDECVVCTGENGPDGGRDEWTTIRMMAIMMTIMTMGMIMTTLAIREHDGSHQLMHVCARYSYCTCNLNTDAESWSWQNNYEEKVDKIRFNLYCQKLNLTIFRAFAKAKGLTKQIEYVFFCYTKTVYCIRLDFFVCLLNPQIINSQCATKAGNKEITGKS